MDQHVVIGTAGHIDHGKTTLVKALTGVDTDRLAEEKARGITIDLGFAPLDLPGIGASVVDVPGHEAFIRNMVAGATGVDVALLVVAADAGVMPQTREHLAILRFLGVRRGVVALTRCDLAADAEWRALVADEVRTLVAADMGEAWPVVEVSATRGEGLMALRTELGAAAARASARADRDRFRLPVDRVFALAGAGTIVTGTAWTGTLAEGERVMVLPKGREARVRSIQVHGVASPRALPGRRAALALVGIARDDIGRGDVVVSGDGWRTSRVADAELELLPGVALKPRARVRVHHGTAEVLARCLQTAPGLARLSFEAPLVLRAGDRFVLRSYSPVATIGGGTITEPWVDALPKRPRRLPERLALEPGPRVAALVGRRGVSGLTRAELEVASGLDAAAVAAAFADPRALGLVIHEGIIVTEAAVATAAERMAAALAAWHVAMPLEAGMPAQAWRATGGATPAVAAVAEERLLALGAVVRAGGLVHQPGFAPGASDAARAGQDQVLERLKAADAEPPSVGELAAALPGIDVSAVLRLLARAGTVVQVAPDRYYEAEALGRERDRLVAAIRASGPASPAELKGRLGGRSRKWLIPLLEWADREGLTVREGDRRRLHVQAGA